MDINSTSNISIFLSDIFVHSDIMHYLAINFLSPEDILLLYMLTKGNIALKLDYYIRCELKNKILDVDVWNQFEMRNYNRLLYFDPIFDDYHFRRLSDAINFSHNNIKICVRFDNMSDIDSINSSEAKTEALYLHVPKKNINLDFQSFNRFVIHLKTVRYHTDYKSNNFKRLLAQIDLTFHAFQFLTNDHIYKHFREHIQQYYDLERKKSIELDWMRKFKLVLLKKGYLDSKYYPKKLSIISYMIDWSDRKGIFEYVMHSGSCLNSLFEYLRRAQIDKIEQNKIVNINFTLSDFMKQEEKTRAFGY